MKVSKFDSIPTEEVERIMGRVLRNSPHREELAKLVVKYPIIPANVARLYKLCKGNLNIIEIFCQFALLGISFDRILRMAVTYSEYVE